MTHKTATLIQRKLTLNDRLAAFDPAIHGGEAMPIKPVGQEKL